MEIVVKLTEKEKKDALIIYARDAAGVEGIYYPVEVYPSLGEVVFRTKDHDNQAEWYSIAKDD